MDRWAIMTFEEEIVTLQQFLRFGETKSIVELMALQDKEGQAVVVPTTRTNSDIRSFIESSMQRSVRLPAKAEAPGCSNGHHFETLVNSMTLMLPLLNSVPAPFLSSATDSSCQEAQTKHEATEISLDAVAPFNAGPIRAEVMMDTESTKMESEEFNVSGNSSPSTPCTPSITSEITQMSPDNKMRCAEKSGNMKKGRVFCSACEKTFYDKGTLKIHYNAVHLKIKHKCTIEGCNMVFSSLRSRNRHSANPNPRLHMPMNRNNRDKDLRGGLSPAQEDDDADDDTREFTSGPESQRTVSSFVIRNSEPKVHNSFTGISQSGMLFPNLKTVQPVLPFYRSLVTPAELAHTPGNLPSLPLLSSSVDTNASLMETSSEPAPKKKSRKSSMPIKIEKDELAAEDVLSEESPALSPCTDTEKCHSVSMACETQGGPVDREIINQSAPLISMSKTQNTELDAFLTQENSYIISPSSSLVNQKKTENHNSTEKNPKCDEPPCSSQPDRPCSQPSNFTVSHAEHCTDSCSDPETFFSDDREEQSHPCEICNKTFKNPYSVKMHYRNVHLKEMHMCTVDGCNAAFPSRRSRDR